MHPQVFVVVVDPIRRRIDARSHGGITI